MSRKSITQSLGFKFEGQVIKLQLCSKSWTLLNIKSVVWTQKNSHDIYLNMPSLILSFVSNIPLTHLHTNIQLN